MSDKAMGLKETVIGGIVVGLVLLVVPSFVQWLFPNWDAFFAWGSRTFGVIWDALTHRTNIAVAPLIVFAIVVLWLLKRSRARYQALQALLVQRQATSPGVRVFSKGLAPTLNPVNKSGFDVGEIEILSALLHSSNAFETVDADFVINNARHPRMVMNAAAEKLQQRQLIEITSGQPRRFKFTPAGKALTMDQWNAAASGFSEH